MQKSKTDTSKSRQESDSEDDRRERRSSLKSDNRRVTIFSFAHHLVVSAHGIQGLLLNYKEAIFLQLSSIDISV